MQTSNPEFLDFVLNNRKKPYYIIRLRTNLLAEDRYYRDMNLIGGNRQHIWTSQLSGAFQFGSEQIVEEFKLEYFQHKTVEILRFRKRG